MAVFIAIFIVMGILIYFIAVSLRIVVESAGRKVNAYFLSKLSVYDEDFGEKLEEVQRLEQRSDELRECLDELRSERGTLESSRFYKPRPLMRDTYIPVARYIDNSFFEDYKMTKKLLDIDKEEIIRGILENFPYTGDIERYRTAEQIIEELNTEALYDLISLMRSSQIRCLKESFSEPEWNLFREYFYALPEEGAFDMMEFLNWLKQIIRKESPYLTAYVGEKDEDYSYISPYVICGFDKNVCEGIRIIYQNKLYDYSIYESRKKNERIY